LVDRLAILVAVRRFLGMGVVDSRSLRFVSYIRLQHFVRQTTSFPFRRFLGDVRREFNVFMLLFKVPWVPISVTLCRRGVLTLWHAFLFLGLGFFLFSSFCVAASAAFSCKRFSFTS
jgi:hypothetical protein